MPSAAPFILFVQTAAGRLLQTISNYFKLAQSEPKYFKGHRIEPASCFYELKLFLWSRYEMYKWRKLDNRFGFEKLHHILPLFWLVAGKFENTVCSSSSNKKVHHLGKWLNCPLHFCSDDVFWWTSLRSAKNYSASLLLHLPVLCK